MTNLSAFWLEEHKGSLKHTTTAKPAEKQSKRPSSLYSPCYPVSSIKLRQHFPFLSSPSRSPQSSKSQHTNNMCLRTTSTGQHFLGDSPNQKIPGSAQTCWEKATLISCSSSTVHDLLILEYRSQGCIPTPTRWKGKPLQLPTLPAGKATTSNPILTAEKHTSGGKLKSLLLEGKQCKNFFSC